MKRRILGLVAVSLLLCGCGGGETLDLTVRNLTGDTLTELTISPEADQSRREECLAEALSSGEETVLHLSGLAEEDLAGGFPVVAVTAQDGQADPLGSLMLRSGDTLTLYWDDLGLAAAVNTSDEEVQEMIDRLHEDLAAQDEAP